MATSQRPVATRRAAAATECVPAAQAVQITSEGPRQPSRMEIPARPALAIIIGTRRGDTRRAPFSLYTPTWSANVSKPPTPVAKMTPAFAGSTSISPASSKAMCGRGHGELGEPIDLADLLRAEPMFGVEVAGLAPDDRGMQESLPECVDTHPAAADRTEAGDGDAPPPDGAVGADAELHQSLDEIRS